MLAVIWVEYFAFQVGIQKL